MSNSSPPDLRDVMAKLSTLSSQFAEHKVASGRRADEMLEQLGGVTAAQKSNSVQIHDMRVEIVRATDQSKRAIELALDAKRVATESVLESKAVLDSVVSQQGGLDTRLTEQDRQLAALRFETSAQTSTLKELARADVTQTTNLHDLLVAEHERKIVESARDAFLKKNAESMDRNIKNGAALFGLIAGIVGALFWLFSRLVH